MFIKTWKELGISGTTVGIMYLTSSRSYRLNGGFSARHELKVKNITRKIERDIELAREELSSGPVGHS